MILPMRVAILFLGTLSLARADAWLYQLQSANPRRIERSGFRCAVIDYSRDGSDRGKFPRSQIRKLSRAGTGTFAYLSIGEAENYRFYWNPAWVEKSGSDRLTAEAPDWLGRTNPDWRGNYKVRYWDSDWRKTVLAPYLDRIVGQGFDGVYLDIVDGFEYWADPASYRGGGETFRPGDPRGNEREAARRMIELVRWIAAYGRKQKRGRFLVMPQNGESILRYDRGGKYLRAISGIGVEDLFYDETREQPLRESRYRLKFLRKIRNAGKTVLCVDYVDSGRRTDPGNLLRVESFVKKCGAERFDCYAARRDRELDRINTIPGIQP